MESIRKPMGYLLCALGLIVAVQFIAYPAYADRFDTLAWEIWGYINFGTAAGAIIAVVVSFMRWRDYDRTSLRDSIGTGSMFMLSGAFALLFFEQWPAGRLLVAPDDAVPAFRSFMWVMVDVSFPVLMAWVASYLLSSDSKSAFASD